MSIDHRQLRSLELELRRKYRLPTSGRHLGHASGFGIVPDGAKPYEPGDPARLIDWHASARTGELTVRKRQIEHYARALVYADYQARSIWGGGEALVRKSEFILAATEAMVHLLAWQGDRISLLLSGGQLGDSRMQAGSRAIRRAKNLLASAQPAANDTLAAGLASPHLVRHRPQLIIVVGDFLSPAWESSLQRLTHKHEVIAVQALDPWDQYLPNLGKAVRIRGTLVDTRSAKVREAYNRQLAANQARREAFWAAAGIRHLLIHNNQPLIPQLVTALAPPAQQRSA